jgi:CBS domain-containing protein
VNRKDSHDFVPIDTVGALVVTDDKRKVLGLITERDIARGLKTNGRDVVDKPLLELMTKDAIRIDMREPLSKAEIETEARALRDYVSGRA